MLSGTELFSNNRDDLFWMLSMLKSAQRLLTMLLLTIAAACCRSQASAAPPPSNVKTDEVVLFFPTYGRFDHKTMVWRFDVHGKVFEPENSSAKRAALIAALRVAGLSVTADGTAFRDDRIRPFLVDNERGKSVTIKVAGQLFPAGTSAANGHFSSSLTLPADSDAASEATPRVVEIEAVLPDADSRSFTGRVHLISPQGVSVISDIDDTIKHSQVTDKSELLRNTFLRDFHAVEGMPQLYAGLARSGVAFHYVSGSPWQLYGPLDAFVSDAGLPDGTFHLKQFRLKDASAIEMFSSQQESKLAAIKPLLAAFPERDFILIGDSGEQDPEIYGRLAREHADQIIGVFIRNVTSEESDNERFSKAFRSVPRDHWTLFEDVSQIDQPLANLAKTQH
jgi:phosphatidate phosphatase APP1